MAFVMADCGADKEALRSLRVGYTFYEPNADGQPTLCKVTKGPIEIENETGFSNVWTFQLDSGEEQQLPQEEILAKPFALSSPPQEPLNHPSVDVVHHFAATTSDSIEQSMPRMQDGPAEDTARSAQIQTNPTGEVAAMLPAVVATTEASVVTPPSPVETPNDSTFENEPREETGVPIDRSLRSKSIKNLSEPPPGASADSMALSPRMQSPEISIGFKFLKKFDDGKLYEGEVVRGLEDVEDESGTVLPHWRVRYEDDDEEEITTEAISECLKQYPNRAAAKRDVNAVKKSSISKGYTFFKLFEDGGYYKGKVVGGQTRVKDPENGEFMMSWPVCYEDDQTEDLTTEEILECHTEDPRLEGQKTKRARLAAAPAYEKALISLLYIPGISREEAERALQRVGSPYGLQAVMNSIQAGRDTAEHFNYSGKFNPKPGMMVRPCQGGAQYEGEITSEARLQVLSDGRKVRMWEVTYYEEGGIKDDLDWNQLLISRADRPTRLHPCRGRSLNCLELFSGCGVVSQEFAERRWRVRSIDNSEFSNASDRMDLMKFEFRDIGFVPDFIWASPPCFTYSLMAAGRHRSVARGEYELTPQAHEQNYLFAKMAHIMHQAKAKNPHLIVVIENPSGGCLKDMPLMKELESSLGIERTEIDYCAFGREDKKPTSLWTNDYRLRLTLSDFRCKPKRCRFHGRGNQHPTGVRGHGSFYNFAAIPEALAEEVAEYVSAKFYFDGIRNTKGHLVEGVPGVEDVGDVDLVPGEVLVAGTAPAGVDTGSESTSI